MVHSTRLIFAALLLVCCGVISHHAALLVAADLKEPAMEFAGDSGDPRAKLVVPQAWPFAGGVEQPPSDYLPPTDSASPVSLPRFHAQPEHRPAADRTLHIRPRSVNGANTAADLEYNGPVVPVVPEPWPFVQPKRKVVAGAAAFGEQKTFSGVPLWPLLPNEENGLPNEAERMVSDQPEFGPTPFDQTVDESQRPILPGAVPDPIPLDIVDEERAVFPGDEESDGGELQRQQREQQRESQRVTGQHTPPSDLPATPSKRSRNSDSTGRGRNIPSPSWNVIGRHADEHVGYGFDLAEKGAVHSAHAEFVEALSIIADALDGEGDESHRAALIAGLRAMDEANDFARRGKPLEAAIDFRRLKQLHKTPVLAADDPEDLTPYVAMQRYFVFAGQRLAYAGGETPAASRALYGLGRIQPYLAGQAGSGNSLAGPKGIALHRAALKADPRNHQAANELGVLLARYGQLSAAADAFRHSLAVRPVPEAWHNLARVYEQQGHHSQARLARSKRQSLIADVRIANGNRTAESAIRWVDSAEFSPAPGRTHLAGRTATVKSPTAPIRSPMAEPNSNASSNPFQRIGRIFTRNRRQ
ncbi:MAG: hypothetical protein HON53_10990 [Planctomycetaceae bacterium]|nr:hypothetical protein [Planctomycetaceae bacterium]MBT6153907.1 hypothetical protein [Planctomycetaceae bacterium]MBT6486622.1 hypothetical protein [Planctomycetaceae bacterium]MBT6496828.1 hypothetical protein [Planctomycetaceae bacterium]